MWGEAYPVHWRPQRKKTGSLGRRRNSASRLPSDRETHLFFQLLSGSPGCSPFTDFKCASRHSLMSQCLKINVSLYMYTSYWFCFSGKLESESCRLTGIRSPTRLISLPGLGAVRVWGMRAWCLDLGVFVKYLQGVFVTLRHPILTSSPLILRCGLGRGRLRDLGSLRSGCREMRLWLNQRHWPHGIVWLWDWGGWSQLVFCLRHQRSDQGSQEVCSLLFRILDGVNQRLIPGSSKKLDGKTRESRDVSMHNPGRVGRTHS